MHKHEPAGGAAAEHPALAAAQAAARAIPPTWPLEATVAVNPFLGQTGENLPHAAARLARVAAAPVTMPRAWYRERIESGVISDADLAAALARAPRPRPPTVAALKAAAADPDPEVAALPTIADLAAEGTGVDYPELIAERIGLWAAGYFDRGQALWAAPQEKTPYTAWRATAIYDLTPEIAGVRGFAARVAEAPRTAEETIIESVATLGLDEAALPTYFHRLLATLGGWAQYARHLQWQAELAGEHDDGVVDLLAIRLIWEQALYDQHTETVAERWRSVRAAHAEPLAPDLDQVTSATLQEAAERAEQRRLAATFLAPAANDRGRPSLQAAFCIDVRSEVIRRALESVDDGIETLGFAGFFGLPLEHRRFASDVTESRLPVLLEPELHTRAGGPEYAEADRKTRLAARAVRAWGRFKLAAVSSFAFIEAAGPLYVGKLLRGALARPADHGHHEPPPKLDPELPAAERVTTAETILRAMSLTDGFARLVVLTGHGANVVNNPHASALHCGACGGYAGDVNARLLAALLNDAEVRTGLAERGIRIPDDTLFVGALHDTTTDTVTLYDDDCPAPGHATDLDTARRWLRTAGEIVRGERTRRLPRARTARDIHRRSRDWAEVRPEWGLAGCKAFIAAPRHRTVDRQLEGRTFLHNYDWRADEGFEVLELIMTAPVVVASWISLQYYGSVVAPTVFGAGNKLLHNVVGGMGVLEGNDGPLRVGMPWQSVHDGERLVHEPLRLTVVIEAPTDAMNDVLARHPQVRALFDNGWLHLIAMDDGGSLTRRYCGNLRWEPTEGQERDGPALATASAS
ncbi:hypothetical protein PC39_03567 [Salinisphaera sp. PC39]|uniref:YbcC family protein n=1 Tax=Salinisphaera sp. PC39 TaxID=1304156 RepID=UPI003342621A